MVNTHHLHEKIEAFVNDQQYPVPVHTRYEPDILGTGGAIANLTDFWDERPFFVINSDILTDIDLRAVYAFHQSHSYAVTLVLYDDPAFNTVTLTPDGYVDGFSGPSETPETLSRTFTGIQVLDPSVVDRIPSETFYSSIDLYQALLREGERIRAFLPDRGVWQDLGTPERYQAAVREALMPVAFRNAFSGTPDVPVQITSLAGDGSDRQWFRITTGDGSLILCDHGIRTGEGTAEVDAFVRIGRHLKDKGVPVPDIYAAERFAGLVILEDLGNLHLQECVHSAGAAEAIVSLYRPVIEDWARMAVCGAADFDPAWTYQTPAYDRELVLEKECRYFLDAFLNGVAGMACRFELYQEEFERLADGIFRFGISGFLHRDFQSRNIMIKNGRGYFIDFQGGRQGPVQYDLASLLIDPYVDLPPALQERLLDAAILCLEQWIDVDPVQFRKGYRYCSLSRNLQILGAFGFLSRVRQKTSFAQYIPAALRHLKRQLAEMPEFPRLKALVGPVRG